VHPILSKGKLGLYLAAWLPVGSLLASLAKLSTPRSGAEAALLALPLAVVYGFVCLGSWSLCRAMPIGRRSLLRIGAAQGAAAVVSSGLWVLIGGGWSAILGRSSQDSGTLPRFLHDIPLFFSAGVFLYLLSATLHYLLIAFEASREAETQALELQVLARDAQLSALTAQVKPHFLFNSLNSISALTASDPQGARRMCLLLADFLRRSVALGRQAAIPLGDEAALARTFLAIEQVRFGERLGVEIEMEQAAEACLVPPLLLQPLVENAVGHGIAHRVEGGTVRLRARLAAGRLEILVENPCDPERPASRGAGVGLANVRARLAAVHGSRARLEVESEPERFRVTILLPATQGAAGDAGGGAVLPGRASEELAS